MNKVDFAIRVAIVLAGVIIGMSAMRELDKGYKPADFSGGCPQGYMYDIGGCVATDPLRMLADINHGLLKVPVVPACIISLALSSMLFNIEKEDNHANES